MSDADDTTSTAEPSLDDAVDRWASSVFGAPRNFRELVTGRDTRDEVIERVATEIVRRDLREERFPSLSRSATSPRSDPTTVDPFQHTIETLRNASEHVVRCDTCRGLGNLTCGPCRGSGRVSCSTCGGTGKELKRYKNGNTRQIKCKVCKTTGVVGCRSCGASGHVTCRECQGSGHQNVWLTFDERKRVEIAIVPENEVAVAHPVLRERRVLVPRELSTFTIQDARELQGALSLDQVIPSARPLVQRHLVGLDVRRERVVRQQYIRAAVLRRDVTYSMCGSTARVVFSGRDLLPADTRESRRPIRRRLHLWIAAIAALGVGTELLHRSLVGRSAYFSTANRISLGLVAGSLVLAIPWVGALLRALRPRLRFGAVHVAEGVFLGAWLAALVALVVVGITSRPSVDEAHAALAAGNVARARSIADALNETTAGAATSDAEDRVEIAEAKSADLDRKLRILDSVAARHGRAASEASALARSERLRGLHDLIAAKRVDDALAKVDRWFPNGKNDVDVAESVAEAYDAATAQCASDPCRLVAANNAVGAHATDGRRAAAAGFRAKIANELSSRAPADQELASRLHALNVQRALATEVGTRLANDEALAAAANAATAWDEAERAKVALLGNGEPVAEELLGALTEQDKNIASVDLDGETAYLALDKTKRCRGVYVVGPKKGDRTLRSRTWPAEQLLSQALGHHASVRTAVDGTVSWSDGGTPVTARWHHSELMELRVGDAAP